MAEDSNFKYFQSLENQLVKQPQLPQIRLTTTTNAFKTDHQARTIVIATNLLNQQQ